MISSMHIISAIRRNVTEWMMLPLVPHNEFYLPYLQPVKNTQFVRDYLLKRFYWRHVTAIWKLRKVFYNHNRYIFTHSCVAVKIQTMLTLCEESKKTNKMQQLDVYYQLLSQHVSGIIMPIFRRTKTVLLHLVCCSGSAGCGW